MTQNFGNFTHFFIQTTKPLFFVLVNSSYTRPPLLMGADFDLSRHFIFFLSPPQFKHHFLDRPNILWPAFIYQNEQLKKQLGWHFKLSC